eukprot:6286978-Amphidinium_carterae.1
MPQGALKQRGCRLASWTQNMDVYVENRWSADETPTEMPHISFSAMSKRAAFKHMTRFQIYP